MESESGVEFLTRLVSKPIVLNLNEKLFPNGFCAKETAEVVGDTSIGKTLLLIEIIGKNLLPIVYGGLGISILLINTDNHFKVSHLFTTMIRILNKNYNKIDEEADKICRESLKNLLIINCFDFFNYLGLLHSLESILLKNETINLIVIDSISSFYWLDRERTDIEKFPLDQHVKNMLKIIQKNTFKINVSIIYTKSREIIQNNKQIINCTSDSKIGNINYRINLYECNKKFYCTIETSNKFETIEYKINDNGFQWK